MPTRDSSLLRCALHAAAVQRGREMLAEGYRISYAHPADEMLTELGKFVDYVRNGPIGGLLPSALHDISVHDAGDVAKWQDRIDRIMHDLPTMNATERFWLHEIDEVFKAARRRLDELLGAGRDAPASMRRGG